MSQTTTNIIPLTCCCCGSYTTGRQWHNRDTGYGLCQSCASWMKTNTSPEDMTKCYGKEGYHFPDQNGDLQQ